MAADLFDTASQLLEQKSDLNRLEARGTLRLALKAAGLDPNYLTLKQLQVVFDKVMPEELEKRFIADAVDVCASVMEAVSDTVDLNTESSDEVFSRIGGD